MKGVSILPFAILLLPSGCQSSITNKITLPSTRDYPEPTAQQLARAAHLSADKLYTLYFPNLAQGGVEDDRFMGKPIYITGVFDSMENGYVALRTHVPGVFVYARMKEPASFQPGETLHLLCIGNASAGASPMLADCVRQ